jgi:hypothetical protein
MSFFRPNAGYRRRDKSRKHDVREELNIVNLTEKVKENKEKYLGRVTRIPTHRIQWKIRLNSRKKKTANIFKEVKISSRKHVNGTC